MVATPRRVPLLLDANAIIDLAKLGVLADVLRLPRYEPLVTPIVRGEVRRPEQAEALAAAIATGAIGQVALEGIEQYALLAPITKAVGTADAECLVAASQLGGLLASDETRRTFMREARRLIGGERLVRLHALLAEAIASGLVTMERLRGAVAALAATAESPRDRDDVEHLERVLARVEETIDPRREP
jgi:hypothetical protein